MTSEVTQHLEFIQNAIDRMARNSFSVKGWTVALTTGLFALAAKEANSIYILIAVYPALALWGLDAYYVRQERLFRKLYDAIAEHGHSEHKPFLMSTSRFKGQVDSWAMTLKTPTVSLLHGVVFIALIAFSIILSK